MNFAGATSGETRETKDEVEEKSSRLRAVEVSSVVLLKIVKHCEDAGSGSGVVTGQLLGLDVGDLLEVTDCFAIPDEVREGGGDGEAGATYQLEMMRCLREVNVDDNHVGWYQTTRLGNAGYMELIETFLSYAENLEKCVCLVYEPGKSGQGVLSIKAVQVTAAFAALYRQYRGRGEGLGARDALPLTSEDVFEEIPVYVSDGTLANVFITQLAAGGRVGQCDVDRLGLAADPVLEENVKFLGDCVYDLGRDQQTFLNYLRDAQRQEGQRAQWIYKRQVENNARRNAGQEPLPEMEPDNPLFKPIAEPGRLENLLLTRQVRESCSQSASCASGELAKLYAAKQLQAAQGGLGR